MQPNPIYQRLGPGLVAAALLVAPTTSQNQVHDVLSGLKSFDLAHVTVPPDRPEWFSTTVFLEGEELELQLVQQSVWAQDAVVEVHRQDGAIDFLPAPAPNTYTGHVVGVPGSAVFASLMTDGLHASIGMPGREIRMIEPVDGKAGVHAVYRAQDVDAKPSSCEEPAIEGDHADLVVPQVPSSNSGSGSSSNKAVAGTAYVAELALDTDFEYCQTFILNTALILDELAMVVNNANGLGFTAGGTGITHILTKAVIRLSPADPYSSTDGATINGEQVTEWTTNETDTPYDLVLLFTGKDTCSTGPSGCGLAGRANVIGDVCNRDTAFCFTEYRANDITQFQIAAHELGHLWDGRHCDNDPGSGCVGVGPCRLMCSTINGCDNIVALWGFGSCNAGRVIAHRDSRTCLDTATDVEWVEWKNFPSIGAGTLIDPWNSLGIAVNNISDGGTIVIFEGASSTSPLETVPLTIDKHVRIQAFNGPATIDN